MRILRNLTDTKTKTATGSDNADGREGRDVSEARGTIEIYVYVTAVSGTTPTLDISYDDGFQIEAGEGTQSATAGGAVYRNNVATFNNGGGHIIVTGLYLAFSITDYGTMLRFSWTIGGTTPSFTFEIYAVYEAAD